MKILPDVLEFEWDKGNIDKNFISHGVTNKEAEEVFANKPNFIFEDVKHSIVEKRYMIWGVSDASRKLSIIFAMRRSKIRVISARDIHIKERRAYEEKIKTNTEI